MEKEINDMKIQIAEIKKDTQFTREKLENLAQELKEANKEIIADYNRKFDNYWKEMEMREKENSSKYAAKWIEKAFYALGLAGATALLYLIINVIIKSGLLINIH